MALRVYVDTSVFGGCFDEEFAEPSRRLMEAFHRQQLTPVISDAVVEELKGAPPQVRQLLVDLAPAVELVVRDETISALRDAYVEARVLGRASRLDAEHIAAATVAGVDLVVSSGISGISSTSKRSRVLMV